MVVGDFVSPHPKPQVPNGSLEIVVVITDRFLLLIHVILFIFNGLVVVFDGKSRNIEKELSYSFAIFPYP